ncbi:peptidoglycan-binding protein LysM, partial [Actinomyces oris]
MEGDMGARQRLALLAGASGAVLILLGRTAHGAAEQLAKLPPQSWGLSELSDAVVAGTCACGTLGALWHVVSALLALMALPAANGPDPLRPGGTSALAARILATWGAPAVRRITASALLVSLSSAPALAAQDTGGGDDLGWRPTSSAPASPPSQSSTPSPP